MKVISVATFSMLLLIAVKPSFGQRNPAGDRIKKPAPVDSVEAVKLLDEDLEKVAIELKDKETLEALAERLPKLKRLSIHYRPNGAMPKGAIAELTKFKELESLFIKGDPQISDDEIASISEIKSLKNLNLSLP